ncbi:hypothetical protein BDF19DRAFT_443969 [Syncephalis fuscata]|nr:hypothetical protein BDF19DRAFT_443969 [Syncephalis fuscata]
MKFAVTKVAKFIAVLVVLAASADARPSSQRSISTRLGGDCDLIDGINYECTSGLKCDTMPDSKEFVTRRPYSKQIYGTDGF